MLSLIRAEYKKMSNLRITRILWIISFAIPLGDLFLCVRYSLKYPNLLAQNIFFGNFLVVPGVFFTVMITLLQVEEQNDALKNVLLTGVRKRKILMTKFLAALIIAVLLTVMLWVTGLACSFLLGGNKSVWASFIASITSFAAALGASMPIMLIIILLRKKFLLSMILSNILLIADFLLVWQLTMLEGLHLRAPIMIAYRITYPLQIFKYSPALQIGLDKLHYPLGGGLMILLVTTVLSGITSFKIYEIQEV